MNAHPEAKGTLGLLRPDLARFRDHRFWKVQFLVLSLAILHGFAEYLEWSERMPHGHTLYFVPEALMLIPVGYAALNFGLHGAVATALWSSLLVLPNLVLIHHGREVSGVLVQLAVLNAVAFFGGQRVEREVAVRRQNEVARAALEASELRFRSLFENSADGVLVLDRSGLIHEANTAAAHLLGCLPGTLRGQPLAEIVGAEMGAELLEVLDLSGRNGRTFQLQRDDGPTVYLQPLCTVFTGRDGQSLLQVSLRDVTQQQLRERDLRTYAASILQAQEEERRRIARELHDETLQTLVVLCRNLDLIETAAEDGSPAQQTYIEASRSTAHQLMAALRKFTRQLRPPALDELGVVACIHRMVTDAAAECGIDGKLTVYGRERRLSGEIELGLFRIAQEAIRNVERHARASQILATVRFTSDQVCLVIADDGQGFVRTSEQRQGDAKGGLGLLGMDERTAMLGGKLEIMTGPGQGTRVVATIPA